MTAKRKKEVASTLLLSDRALSDLLEIETYSGSVWGKVVASKYILKFEKAFRLLENNPELAIPFPELGSDLRFYRVEKHLLVCVRVARGMVVVTVAHANRDLEFMMAELSPTLRAEAKSLLKKINGSE